ncbi:hypothetical protein ACS0TY_020049 [Phlomoides rotata]
MFPDVPIPSLDDYEVAELTWENGQLTMHGLGIPRAVNKPPASSSRAAGTLESIVNKATDELVPWFEHHREAAPAPAPAPVDALVPSRHSEDLERSGHVWGGNGIRPEACSTRVGSCSGAITTLDGGDGEPRVPRADMSESATCGTQLLTVDTWDRELGGASASMASLENTISGHDYTKTSADDHDSISRSKSQRTGDEAGKRKFSIEKSSVSTKRSRAAAIHNQSERKRRDKINQRMKTLQKLVPNSSKTDKASMLEEVIEYLKQLQAQVQMMNMPSMMLPLAMQQQLQMSMMGMGMGVGVMDMNAINRAAAAAVPPVIPPAAAFMPAAWGNPGDCLPKPPAASLMPDPLAAAVLACQSQPMNMDAYRLAAMYLQMRQHPA